jgi:hypothetical protein
MRDLADVEEIRDAQASQPEGIQSELEKPVKRDPA